MPYLDAFATFREDVRKVARQQKGASLSHSLRSLVSENSREADGKTSDVQL